MHKIKQWLHELNERFQVWLHEPSVSLEQLEYYKGKEKEAKELGTRLRASEAFVNQYQTENEEMEKKIDSLEDANEKLAKENNMVNIEIGKLTQLDRVMKIDLNYLEDFEPSQIKAMMNLITLIQRQIVEDSLGIRVIEGIAHRDGAFRALGIMRANLGKMLKDIKKQPKEEK